MPIAPARICVQKDGAQYIKMTVFTTDGIHRVEKLSDVAEHFYEEVKAEFNANHLVGMGWLAVPGTVEVSERQVAALLPSIGAWDQVKVTA